MVVPPFVPDALEVEGSVVGERYAARLAFIRKVARWHLASVVGVLLLAYSGIPAIPLEASAPLLILSVVLLSLVRQVRRFSAHEQIFSLALSPLMFVSLAYVLKEAMALGAPVWSPIVGLLCAVFYAHVAGRDFSFVWAFILSGAASTAIILLGSATITQAGSTPLAAAINLAYLLYWVYDLACLQSRRRRHEVGGAVIDLYRDVLNFVTYSFRVVLHWRRYRIWAAK